MSNSCSARYKAMSAHHCYHGMEYSEDRKQIADWAPLIIEGRDENEPIAATRIVTGTDVDYGSLTHLLVAQLVAQAGFSVHYKQRVVGLEREAMAAGALRSRMWIGARSTRSPRNLSSSVPAAERCHCCRSRASPRGTATAAFRSAASGCAATSPAVSDRHHAKVYGKAAEGSPPMSVPHLDTRIIGGARSLLFGPYAGFSTRFLKHGSLTDLFRSIEPGNIMPMLAVARDNAALSEYLIGQVLQTSAHQFATLQQFFPIAKRHEWQQAIAGQRVQIIKPDEERTGVLEFGTELIGAEDRSLVALLGASPGASTAAFIAIGVLRKCFPDELTESAWLPKLKQIIPTYGIDLTRDADACRRIRAETAPLLKIDNI